MPGDPSSCEELQAGDDVEGHSLQAKPEHHGKTGRLVALDAVSGRWEVRLADGGALRVRGANLTKSSGSGATISEEVGQELRAGDDVEVHSLQAKPEHNGKTGRLAAIDAVSGRWEVRMAGGASLRVRAANLVKRRGSSRGAGWGEWDEASALTEQAMRTNPTLLV